MLDSSDWLSICILSLDLPDNSAAANVSDAGLLSRAFGEISLPFTRAKITARVLGCFRIRANLANHCQVGIHLQSRRETDTFHITMSIRKPITAARIDNLLLHSLCFDILSEFRTLSSLAFQHSQHLYEVTKPSLL